MFRSPRAVALRAGALVVAALTARTVATDVGAIHAQARALGPLRGVVVASRTLQKGETVARGAVRVVERHTGEEPAGTLTALDQAVGHTITIDVAAGAPVLHSNIARERVGMSGALATDARVVRIVDAGGLAPEVGAIVDVYATFGPTADAGTTPTASLVARAARVLRVDHAATDIPAAHTTASSSGILVMVRASETAGVASAVANGVVTVAIAPVEDACCADP